MIIKKASIEELDKLTKILIEFKEEVKEFEQEEFRVLKNKKKPYEIIKNSVEKKITNEKSLFLVAYEKDEIVGFMDGILREFNHLVYEPFTYGEIMHIWVKEEFRKNGISSALKDKLFKWFKTNNCKYVKLYLLDKNPALGIYEKWGFEPVMKIMKKKLE
ncbi:MAG: GNAT family N-acetyltransferase [Candidatus Aenigmarchaeota archaeon]|nr:GNAT family N-acetyltransferase [Candidatus Aenigmarchaeota archaeon]